MPKYLATSFSKYWHGYKDGLRHAIIHNGVQTIEFEAEDDEKAAEFVQKKWPIWLRIREDATLYRLVRESLDDEK